MRVRKSSFRKGNENVAFLQFTKTQKAHTKLKMIIFFASELNLLY